MRRGEKQKKPNSLVIKRDRGTREIFEPKKTGIHSKPQK